MDNSETYDIKIYMFKGGQPEEFLTILKIFRIAIDVTGAASPLGKIKYLCTMLQGVYLRELYELSVQKNGTSNARLNHTTEGLLGGGLKSMLYPSKSAQCAAQCTNLEAFFNDFLHD